VKKGWQTKKLGEICEIERGGSPRPIQKFITTDPKGINWIKIGDATASGKYIYTTEDKIKPEGVKRSRMVYEGDFILSNSMSFGRPYIMKTTGCIHDGWLVLRQPKVDQDYLYHVLGSDLVFRQFDRLAAGSTVRNLNIGLVKTVEIPYPPLPEQQRIVGILDEAFEGIATAKANAEKNLQNARSIFESHLHSVFTQPGEGWVETRFGDVCEYVNGKAHEQCIDEDGRFIVINSKFISTEGKVFKRSNKALLLLKPDDIAMVLSDVPKGKAFAKCFLVEEANKYTLNQRICLIRSKKFHTKFLFYQLNRNRHFLAFDNGENQTNMRLNQVLSCPLFLPTMPEQKIIAERLDSLKEETQRLEALYQRKLAALEELKKSLLHDAFRGAL
jgi:type I restriction enzyme S subunit